MEHTGSTIQSILSFHLLFLLVLLFRFPLSKPQLSSKWVQSLGMKNFVPTANTCLCSEHFRPECFRDYNGKQFLREDAVPTLLTHGQDSSKVGLHSNYTDCLGCLIKIVRHHALRYIHKEKINDSMLYRLNCAKECQHQKRPTWQTKLELSRNRTEQERLEIFGERKEEEWG